MDTYRSSKRCVAQKIGKPNCFNCDGTGFCLSTPERKFLKRKLAKRAKMMDRGDWRWKVKCWISKNQRDKQKTTRELAAEIGVSQPALVQWSTGARPVPKKWRHLFE